MYDCLEQYKYTVIQGNWWTIASVVRYRFYGNADDEALGTDMKPTGKVRLSERQTILVEIWKRKRTPFPPQAKQLIRPSIVMYLVIQSYMPYSIQCQDESTREITTISNHSFENYIVSQYDDDDVKLRENNSRT